MPKKGLASLLVSKNDLTMGIMETRVLCCMVLQRMVTSEAFPVADKSGVDSSASTSVLESWSDKKCPLMA